MGLRLLLIVFGFFSGSVMYGKLLPKWLKGIDVTAISQDKNPGTANAMQYAGVPVGVLCLLCDLAKGTLPVMLFCALFGLEPTFWLSFAVAAPVLGHTCSPWGGGKGIAVSFGVMLGLLPGSMGLLFLIGSYLLFSIIIRIKPHGIRSIVSFAVFFVAMLIWEHHTFLVYGALLMCAAVIIRHLPSARREYEARHPAISSTEDPLAHT